MTRTVYFHIGWGRCGSSSIQQFGYGNRDRLRQRGVFYPTSTEMGLPEFGAANARAMCDLESWRSAVDAVVDYLARSPDQAFLLSSEYLCARGPEYLGAVRDAFAARDIDMVCVAYIREQREWLVSRYAQAVKSRRWTMSLSEYLRERYNAKNLNYHQKFGMLREVYGEGRVLPRIFQRDRIEGGDVRVDLFDLMNVDVRDLIEDEPTANASASALELETMRAVNAVLPAKGFNHRKFLRQSQRYFETRKWRPVRELYRLVEPSLMREIGRFFEQSNEEFRRKFFPAVESPLFRARIPDEYEVLPPEERYSERSIALLLNYFVDLRSQGSPAVASRHGDVADAEDEEHEDVPVDRARRRLGYL